MGTLVRECVGFQQFPVATQEKQKSMNSMAVLVLGKSVSTSSTLNSLIGKQVVRVSPFQAEGLRPLMVSRTMGGFTINIIDAHGLVEAGYVNHQDLDLIKGSVATLLESPFIYWLG
ncbi:AIG1-type guanine nucleotide-binding (G) domain [Arabidopsis thaliana x Arabidopsis arenosa]|uniref:AIG1-type guanine nucleotide-binding (G) domain n=1 Tax=Arabidopsis thaliana x Arabidopsis arenosa TaxID=1240361 RepID=A0A8T2C0C1_9BRAS|nr:AIG1-type guanine nucleotide-binding (G) domain [Arabidopsis thaliana x Arabidopsis arenosa]